MCDPPDGIRKKLFLQKPQIQVGIWLDQCGACLSSNPRIHIKKSRCKHCPPVRSVLGRTEAGGCLKLAGQPVKPNACTLGSVGNSGSKNKNKKDGGARELVQWLGALAEDLSLAAITLHRLTVCTGGKDV